MPPRHNPVYGPSIALTPICTLLGCRGVLASFLHRTKSEHADSFVPSTACIAMYALDEDHQYAKYCQYQDNDIRGCSPSVPGVSATRLAACAALLAVLPQHIVCISSHCRGAGLSTSDDLHQAIAFHCAPMGRH